jgi:ketosteroid isomerase-like protein
MDERDAVLDANRRFYQAFNARDPEAMAAAWASEHPVCCIHPGWMPLAGREAVLTSWERIMSNPDQPRVVPGAAEVSIIGTVAVVVGREFVAGSAMIATNLFVLEGGRWRMFHHQAGGVAVAG